LVGRRGVVLLDLLLWMFIGVVVLSAVWVGLSNMYRHAGRAGEVMGLVGDLSVLDLSLLEDVVRGRDVLVDGSCVLSVNGVVYELAGDSLLRDGMVLVDGVSRFLAEVVDVDGVCYLNVLVECGDFIFERRYSY